MDLTGGSPTTATDPSQILQAPGTHRRTYQACVSISHHPLLLLRWVSNFLAGHISASVRNSCLTPLLILVSIQIPCRKRKVRCDLGPVDDPHDPPCQRCRRESKECYFSATRRKRRASSGEEEIRDGEDLTDEPAPYNVRRKSARASGSFQGEHTSTQDGIHPDHSGSISAGSPLDGYKYRPPEQPRPSSQYSIANHPSGKIENGPDQELTNEAAATLFQSPINTPGDALHLLLQASGQSEAMHRHGTADQSFHLHSSPASAFPSSMNSIAPERSRTAQQLGSGTLAGNIDPAITDNGVERETLQTTKADLAVWSRLRFVRAGWFTAKEAINYID